MQIAANYAQGVATTPCIDPSLNGDGGQDCGFRSVGGCPSNRALRMVVGAGGA